MCPAVWCDTPSPIQVNKKESNRKTKDRKSKKILRSYGIMKTTQGFFETGDDQYESQESILENLVKEVIFNFVCCFVLLLVFNTQLLKIIQKNLNNIIILV